MLAPRKVLWSTPDAVVDRIIQVIPLSESDTVVDLGCGDGRVLLRWAKSCSRSIEVKDCTINSTDSNDNNNNNDDDDNGIITSSINNDGGSVSFLGIDCNDERIEAAKKAWKNISNDDDDNNNKDTESLTIRPRCHSVKNNVNNNNIKVQFYCCNALDLYHNNIIWKDHVTILYLYLTPYGLKRIRPILNQCNILHTIITYMCPLPNATYYQKEKINVPHQPETAWPLYFYKFPQNC